MSKAILFISICLLFACKGHNNNDFYDTIDDFNATYIPILDPYKIVAWGNSERNIFIGMQTDSVDRQVNRVKSISVFDSLIYIESDNEQGMPGRRSKKYFLIEYYHGAEIGFYTKEELIEYTDKKKYPRPSWKGIWEVYDEIKDNGYPWNIELDSMYKKRR